MNEEEKVYDKKTENDFSSNKTGMALKNCTQLCEDEWQTNNILTIWDKKKKDSWSIRKEALQMKISFKFPGRNSIC